MATASLATRTLLFSSAASCAIQRRPETSAAGLRRILFNSILYSPRRRLFCSGAPPCGTAVADASHEKGREEEEALKEDAVRAAALQLDIRVGRVLKAWRHPEADSLYVEEVDVGETEPRTICSGLVNFVSLDDLQGSAVIVLANLKPRNMRGIKSNGMLLAASDEAHEHVELLVPPEGSVPGERVWFGSEDDKEAQPEAATPNQVQKKKIWEIVQPRLRTTDTCIPVLDSHPMLTSAGPVTCKSLRNARVS